jgi:type IV pilus modification protein PilV
MTYQSKSTYNSGGYTLVEVLVGILIFAVGMMALAQLQGNLAQNSSDANARTVAINVAEEVMEAVRSFADVSADGTARTYGEILDGTQTGTDRHAFNDIVDGTATVTRAGYSYNVSVDVSDYYYVPVSKTFVEGKPEGSSAANPDFKEIALTVSWEGANGGDFRIDDDTKVDMGSGSITITDVISSITSPASGKVILGLGGEDNMYAPPVDYSPGQNPDIISINLGQNKFKESTTPLPDVIRSDELVETRFDVVTYSNPVNSSATFLRREEFRAVSCECTLRIPATGEQGGLRPTIWTGSEYIEGEFVSKPYGESANNQQSEFCDICCRDHHDGGTGSLDVGSDEGRSQYGPFRSSDEYHNSGSLSGDHIHYNRDNNGNLEPAVSDGATYVEACRLVRKDGFFRVAQDMRQEGLNSFPGDYLDEPSEINEYSAYVTAAVKAYESDILPGEAYESDAPVFPTPASMSVTFPASSRTNATFMTTDNGVEEQQLRSRGLYIDYMSDELREKINCLDGGGDGDTCNVPEVSSALEVIPFYDVQLTWLSRWTESPNNYPIDVTNQAISDDNSHSRGLAARTGGTGRSTVSTTVHAGNLGLTGTDPIDLDYSEDLSRYFLHAYAGDSATPPAPTNIRISGNISSAVGGVKAADVEISADGASCDRTSLGYECFLQDGATKPQITVNNYFKQGKVLLACNDSGELVVQGQDHSGDNPGQNWVRFYLPTLSSTTTANIVIREGSC